MRKNVLFGLLTLACVALSTRLVAGNNGGTSCTSCGRECVAACGTRQFRACCFNFQRRRRGDFAFEKTLSADGDSIEDGYATGAEASKGLLPSLLHEDLSSAAVDGGDPWARGRGRLSFLSDQGPPGVYPGYERGHAQLRPQGRLRSY